MGVQYKVRCVDQQGNPVVEFANGYLEGLERARKAAARCNNCALLYVTTSDGWKMKNTIHPDGRLIRNYKVKSKGGTLGEENI